MPHVNITRQIRTHDGWRNISLDRDGKGRIKWGSGQGRYIIEWYENGKRRRQAAGITPAVAFDPIFIVTCVPVATCTAVSDGGTSVITDPVAEDPHAVAVAWHAG